MAQPPGPRLRRLDNGEPAAMQGLSAFNILLPGAGMVLRGRLGIGVVLLVPALVALSILPLAGLAATTDFAGDLRLTALLAYVILGLLAGLAWWHWEVPRPCDAARVATLFREVAGHHLAGRSQEALATARLLLRLAPREPGAWRLLAYCAAATGASSLAHRAQAWAQACERRRQGM